MPNWTMNDLEIDHEDPKMIERLAIAFDRGRLFGEFVPEPENYDSCAPPEDEFWAKRWWSRPKERWYVWRVQHWGTKWETGLRPDDGSKLERVSANTVKLSFLTAWSYPEQVLEELLRLGYSIRGQIVEETGKFEVVYDNGVVEEFCPARWRVELEEMSDAEWEEDVATLLTDEEIAAVETTEHAELETS